MPGEVIWKTGLAAIGAVFLLGGIADAVVWLRGKETASIWLVDHMEWFGWPAFLMVVFIVAMRIHLDLLR